MGFVVALLAWVGLWTGLYWALGNPSILGWVLPPNIFVDNPNLTFDRLMVGILLAPFLLGGIVKVFVSVVSKS